MGKSVPPWRDWYHVTVHVYGSWLRGDPRGWRSRHHREHVEGDYKNPPPKGTYDNLYELSKALMKRDPVRIATELRQFVANAIAEKLRSDGIELIVVSVDGKHLHVLGRFPITTRDIGSAGRRSTRRIPFASMACALKRVGYGRSARILSRSPTARINSKRRVTSSTISNAERGFGGLIGDGCGSVNEAASA